MNTKNWCKNLCAGFIAGAANAGASWLAMIGAQASGVSVPTLNWRAFLVLLGISGVMHALIFLANQPLPDIAMTAPIMKMPDDVAAEIDSLEEKQKAAQSWQYDPAEGKSFPPLPPAPLK